MQPLLLDRKTVEGTCECIPIVEQEVNDQPIHVTLATMSIVKDYYDDFQNLRATSESRLSSIMPIKQGLMENMRKILVVLGKPTQHYEMIDLDEILRSYLSKIDRNTAAGASAYGESSNETPRLELKNTTKE